jgi:FixJ family two-component response regulator
LQEAIVCRLFDESTADPERRESEGAMSDLRARFESLSSREREVIVLVTAGLMNKQIAAETGLAEITVKIHRGHVMKKWRPNRWLIWSG